LCTFIQKHTGNTSSSKAWNKIKLSNASLPYSWNAGVCTAATMDWPQVSMFLTDIPIHND